MSGRIDGVVIVAMVVQVVVAVQDLGQAKVDGVDGTIKAVPAVPAKKRGMEKVVSGDDGVVPEES